MTQNARFNIRIDRLPYSTPDPQITGAQLLEMAGRRPPDGWSIVAVRAAGCESLRPTETYDLRARGVEDFVTHQSDRTFSFVLDGIKHEWPAPGIDGQWLHQIAGIDDDGQIVTTGNGAERVVSRNERADLNGRGVEHFRSIPAFVIVVNMKPATVRGLSVTFEQIVAIAVANGLPHKDTITYTMTYRKGPGNKPDGILEPGQSVNIRKGMVFNVTATDKS